ncbi:MAG: hydroxyisourate hydrolase [Planctomycetota bacterium]
MSGITSHVLDTSVGKPGAGIDVVLELNDGGASTEWKTIGTGTTNDDGRVPGLTSETIAAGHYRINFHVGPYFEKKNTKSFYPIVRIEFIVDDPEQHYHVPLLLNPFGYSTYRGS